MKKVFIVIFIALIASNVLCMNKSFDVSSLYPSKIHQVNAGYINATNNSTAKLFYQLFSTANKTLNNSDPLIVWFQGGPGGSSQIGLFLEMGPFKFVGPNMTYNEQTWAKKQNMMFIDQPIGVGASPNGNILSPNTTEGAAVQIAYFFDQFFELYPQFKSVDLYLTGESYAGHYVPSFATKLIEKGYKLAGVAIGDGWTFPKKQFGLSNLLLAGGVISNNRYNKYQGYELESLKEFLNGNSIEATNIFNMETGEIGNPEDVTNITGVDMLNYRKYGEAIDASSAVNFMNSANTRKVLQVPDGWGFQLSNMTIYQLFTWDIYQSHAKQIEKLLTQTRVLLYSGQNDVEVNTASAYKWISEIDWVGMDGFRSSTKNTLKSDNSKIIGFYRNYDSFTFVQVNDAGHLVPADQPATAYTMIQNWIEKNI